MRRFVCVLTASKGVVSGSGASMLVGRVFEMYGVRMHEAMEMLGLAIRSLYQGEPRNWKWAVKSCSLRCNCTEKCWPALKSGQATQHISKSPRLQFQPRRGSKPLKPRGRAAGETDGPGADRGGARGPRVSGQLEIASQSERMLPHFSSWVSRRVQWNHVCAQMCPACH
jgi:hypothetical protein